MSQIRSNLLIISKDNTNLSSSLRAVNLDGTVMLDIKNDGTSQFGAGFKILSGGNAASVTGLFPIYGGYGGSFEASFIGVTSDISIGGAIIFNTSGFSKIYGNGNYGIIYSSIAGDQLHDFRGNIKILGSDSSSLNYALKVDNSSSGPLLYVRNDGYVSGNGHSSSSGFLIGSSSGYIGADGLFTIGSLDKSSNFTFLITGANYQTLGFDSVYTTNTRIQQNAGGVGINIFTTAHDGYSYLSQLKLGIGFNNTSSVNDVTATIHAKGTDSTSSNYALKLENSASVSLLSVRNDGLITTTNSSGGTIGIKNVFETDLYNTYLQIEPAAPSSNKFYISTVGYGFWNYGSSNPNISPIDGTNLSYKNIGFEIVTHDSTSKFIRFNVTDPSSYIQYYAGYNDASFNFQSDIFKFGKNGTYNFLQIDATNAGAGITKMGLGALGALSNITALLHLKSDDSTSLNYALKVDNSSSSPLLYVRNDGRISAPLIQTGNVGLSTGDLYLDTASNIAANGDLVVGRKA
jgi:hypothetical protein